MATQAVVFVQFLEFEGKDRLLQVISQNGTIYQQLLQYQQIVLAMAQQLDMIQGTQYAAQVQMAIESGKVPMITGIGGISSSNKDDLKAFSNGNNIVDRAKEQARQRSEVRQ